MEEVRFSNNFRPQRYMLFADTHVFCVGSRSELPDSKCTVIPAWKGLYLH